MESARGNPSPPIRRDPEEIEDARSVISSAFYWPVQRLRLSPCLVVQASEEHAMTSYLAIVLQSFTGGTPVVLRHVDIYMYIYIYKCCTPVLRTTSARTHYLHSSYLHENSYLCFPRG